MYKYKIFHSKCCCVGKGLKRHQIRVEMCENKVLTIDKFTLVFYKLHFPGLSFLLRLRSIRVEFCSSQVTKYCTLASTTAFSYFALREFRGGVRRSSERFRTNRIESRISRRIALQKRRAHFFFPVCRPY